MDRRILPDPHSPHPVCPACGSDLRGIDAAVCPECGTVPGAFGGVFQHAYIRRTAPWGVAAFAALLLGLVVAHEIEWMDFAPLPMSIWIFGFVFGSAMATLSKQHPRRTRTRIRLQRFCVWLRACAVLSAPVYLAGAVTLMVYLTRDTPAAVRLAETFGNPILPAAAIAVACALVMMIRDAARLTRATGDRMRIGWFVLPALITAAGYALFALLMMVGTIIQKSGI